MGNINLMGNIDLSIIFFSFLLIASHSCQTNMGWCKVVWVILYAFTYLLWDIWIIGLDNWIGIFGSEATIITTTNCGYLTDITGGLCHSNNLVGLKFAYIWTGIFDRYDWWCIGGHIAHIICF